MNKTTLAFVLGMLAGAAALHVALAQSTSAQFRAVNHIGIVVADYEKSLDFYTTVLGAKSAYTLPRPDGSPLLTYLQLNRETFVELIPARPGEATGISHFGMEVGDIDAVIADLRRHGSTVAAARRSPAQALMTRVRDPDQVDIEIMQYGAEALQRKAMDAWQGPSRP